MKKKICLTFEHLVPSNGVSRSAIAIANLLDEQGYDVTLAPLFRIDKKFIEVMNPGVHLQKVFGFYFHGFAQLVDLIPDRFLYWLIFKKHHYDLEIGFHIEMPIKIIAAGCRRSHASNKLAWMHGYDEGLKLRHQYESIGKVVCVSKCNADRLQRELPSIVADYSYNPIDDIKIVELGKESIDLPMPTVKPLFISVGRHSPEKGYMRLLDIVYRLKNEGYKFSLWLVGDGPEHDKLVSYSHELNIDDMVTFTGATKNPHKFTSKADVFICSSFREGYSTSCTEAIMLGIPVITTCVSGGEEIIAESGCGTLCNLDDESLYKAIKAVLDNPNVVCLWKNKLADKKNSFSQKVRAQRLFRIVSDLLRD